jgi:hypothetical protein
MTDDRLREAAQAKAFYEAATGMSWETHLASYAYPPAQVEVWAKRAQEFRAALAAPQSAAPAIDRVKRAAYRLLSSPRHMVYGRDGEFTPCHCEACEDLHAALAALAASPEREETERG